MGQGNAVKDMSVQQFFMNTSWTAREQSCGDESNHSLHSTVQGRTQLNTAGGGGGEGKFQVGPNIYL